MSEAKGGATPRCPSLDGFNTDKTKTCAECGVTFTDQSFPISRIRIGEKDKNDATINEIYWSSREFVVYRSERGVSIQFSDCAKMEKDQRAWYATIAVKLYQLRSILDQMTNERFRSQVRGSFYDSQIAQALALAIDNKTEQANQLLDEATLLATQRAANENRIAYLVSCIASGFLVSLLAGFALFAFNIMQPATPAKSDARNWISYLGLSIYVLFAGIFVVSLWRLATKSMTRVTMLTHLLFSVVSGLILTLLAFGFVGIQTPSWDAYLVASIFGAVGAVFSISLRVNGLELAPSQQSIMNYLVGAVRVLIGCGAGVILLLICTHTTLGDALVKILDTSRQAITTRSWAGWGYAAFLGIVGGFAESLVPNLLGGLQTQGSVRNGIGEKPVLQGIVPSMYKVVDGNSLPLQLQGMNFNSVKTVKIVHDKARALGTSVVSNDSTIKCEMDLTALATDLAQNTARKCDVIVLDDKLNASTLPGGFELRR